MKKLLTYLGGGHDGPTPPSSSTYAHRDVVVIVVVVNVWRGGCRWHGGCRCRAVWLLSLLTRDVVDCVFVNSVVVVVDEWGSGRRGRRGHRWRVRCWRWSVRWWRVVGLSRVLTRHESTVKRWSINSPDRPCHRPVTRQNRDGNVAGDFFLTCPHPMVPCTRDPSQGVIPVSITTGTARRVTPSLSCHTTPFSIRQGGSSSLCWLLFRHGEEGWSLLIMLNTLHHPSFDVARRFPPSLSCWTPNSRLQGGCCTEKL